MSRVGWRRAWRRRVLWLAALAAALLAAASLRARSPAISRHYELFSRQAPATLAHFMADFSNYVNIYSDIVSWAIEEEWSNYTSWRYEVSYNCGTQCAGHVTLRHDALGAAGAGADGDLRHGHARRHRLTARDVRCTRPTLLPWLDLCAETETETLITGTEEGAVVQESASARCGALATLLARCPPDPRALAARRMDAARAALAAPT